MCDYEYSRKSYVLYEYKGNNISRAYFSPGTDVDISDEELESLFQVPVENLYNSEDVLRCLVHDTSTVEDLVNIISAHTLYKPEAVYVFSERQSDRLVTNMKHDFVFNVSAREVRKFNYTPDIRNAQMKENIPNDKTWDKKARRFDFNTSLLNGFDFSVIRSKGGFEINEIHFITVDEFIKTNISKIMKNSYLVRTYYPLLDKQIQSKAEKSQKFDNIISFQRDDKMFRDITEKIQNISHSMNLVYSPDIESLIKSTGDIKFHNCNILEAVIHVNNGMKVGEFVDLEKIFYMVQTTENIPFSKLSSEQETMYYVHKSLSDPTSSNYKDIRVIQDWIDPKIKSINIGDDHRISKEILSRSIGTSVSFKIHNYSINGEKKYMTLNIYKDGRMEIKCFWSEDYGSKVNPGGTYRDIQKSIQKVIDFVKEINKMQYHIPGASIQKIPLPTTDTERVDSNTKIVFYNTINMIEHPGTLDIEGIDDLVMKLGAFVHAVKRFSKRDASKQILEMRYHRVHNYIKLNNVYRHIKTYKDSNPPPGGEYTLDYRKKIVKDISSIFSLTETEAINLLRDYVEKYETKDKKSRRTVSTGTLSEILGRKVSTNTGINIKILEDSPAMYKCLILGISPEMLGLVNHFIKSLICIHANDSSKPFLLHINDDAEVIDEEKGNNEIKKVIQQDYDDDGDDMFGDLDLYLSDESDDEDDGEEEEEEVETKKVARPKAGKTLDKSFISILQRNDEIYKTKAGFDAETYSRKCQSMRQPLSISVELSRKVKDYVDGEYNRLKRAYEKDKSFEREFREAEIHKKAFGGGLEYRDNFYFCPFTWNMASIGEDNPDLKTILPKFDKNNDNSEYYMARTMKSNDIGKPGTQPSYNWYFGFNSSMSVPEKNKCFGCCFKSDKSAKNNKLRDMCLGSYKGDINVKGVPQYILAENKYVPENRYGYLPKKINHIFNQNDSGRKVNKSGSAVDGFEYYVRRGIKEGNKFMNIIKLVNPAIKDVPKHILEFIDEIEDPLRLFMTLKSGSLHRIFIEEDSGEEYHIAELEAAYENFKQFIMADKSVNEDFLWDVLSLPGCILPSGLNIIVCEIIRKPGSKTITIGTIKCPRGFDPQTLYDQNRPSVVMFKKGSRYELICKVTNKKDSLREYRLFSAGDPLISSIIDNFKAHCLPVESSLDNLNLENHMKRVGKNVIDTVYLNPTKGYGSREVISRIETMISDHMYDEGYRVSAQIIDAYGKTVALLLGNKNVIPVRPSATIVSIPTIKETEYVVEDLLKHVEFLSVLSVYENFEGYAPYAFLIDPGDNMESVSDDSIIGILLQNSLTLITRPVPRSQVSGIMTINRPVPTSSQDFILNLDSLFFDKAVTYRLWYDEYIEADNELSRPKRDFTDLRKIYSTRYNFENESYQRLRFELSRYIAYKTEDKYAEKISKAIEENSRAVVRKIVKSILDDLITNQPGEQIEQSLGPLNVAFEEIDEELTYDYSYEKPLIRYECFNRDLDKYRGEDIHCVNNKLFITDNHLISGKKNNYDSMVERIVEELLRIPVKRAEILNNEMNNFVAKVHTSTENSYHIYHDNRIGAQISALYDKGMDYLDKMSKSMDVVNPAVYKETDLLDRSLCKGQLMNLPAFWTEKLKSLDYKYYKIQGNDNCIYSELNKTISEYITDEIINTRNAVAQEVTSKTFSTGWESALKYYKTLWGGDYKNIRTKKALIDNIKLSEDHKLYTLDLSLISRAYDVRFIIISKPTPLNPGGIVCLNTTQSTSSKCIILYLTGFRTFNIVQKGSKRVFELSELPKALFNEWVRTCVSDNTKKVNDPSHLLITENYTATTRKKKVIGKIVPKERKPKKKIGKIVPKKR